MSFTSKLALTMLCQTLQCEKNRGVFLWQCVVRAVLYPDLSLLLKGQSGKKVNGITEICGEKKIHVIKVGCPSQKILLCGVNHTGEAKIQNYLFTNLCKILIESLIRKYFSTLVRFPDWLIQQKLNWGITSFWHCY